MPSGFFHQLHLSVAFEIDAFDNRLNQLRAGDYPTSAADSLIKRLIDDCRDQRARIKQIVNDLPNDAKGAFDRLRSEHRKLIYRLPLLVNLENAQTRRVPWSFVPSIESFAKVLLPGRLVLTSSDVELNYSISWTQGAASGKQPYAVLFVPAIHRIDAFLHVLIGHELFHPTLSPFLANEQSSVLAPLRAACEQYLKGQPPMGPLFERQRLDEMVETVRYIWLRALEELVCDLGCAAIFGPAAVLASMSFFLSHNFDDVPSYPEYYPPFRYRLRTMLDYPFRNDWGKPALDDLLTLLSSFPDLTDVVSAFQTYWQTIASEAATTSDLTAIDSNIYSQIAYSQVASVLDSARRSALAEIFDRVASARLRPAGPAFRGTNHAR
jgi:hypothetical protein